MKKWSDVSGRREMLDVIFCLAFLGLLALYGTVAFYIQAASDPQQAAWLNVFLSAWVALMLGYPTVHLFLKPLREVVMERFAPSWCIEECEGVIKVHGSIPIIKWHAVERQMLSRRQNYMPVEDAYERFGCTMAAIPASPGWLEGRARYAELVKG